MWGRVLSVFRWCGKALCILSGGALAMGIFWLALPMGEIIRQTHGMIGFVLGLVFMGGTVISAVIYWVVTGRSAMEDLLGI